MLSARARTLAALLPAVSVPFLASLFYFVLFSGRPAAQALYTAAKLFTMAWPPLAVLFILREPLVFPRNDWGRRLKALPLGLLAGVLMAALLVGLMATPLGAVATESAGRIRLKALQLGILEWYWPFALFLSLVNSMVEEFYWRWFVYGRMRRLTGVWPAHLLAGAAFAAHHVVVATQFFPVGWGILFGSAVGLGGVAMSILYERQGTLSGAWACHLVADLGIMAIGYRLLF